jgi:hypothetical protein
MLPEGDERRKVRQAVEAQRINLSRDFGAM